MKVESSAKESTASSATNQHQNGHEEVQVDMEGERKDDDDEEMVVSEVLVTGSPSQKSARARHVVQDRSADNISGTYPQVLDISFTHCFNSMSTIHQCICMIRFLPKINNFIII